MAKITSIASADGWFVQESTQAVRIAAWGLLDDGRVVPLTPGNGDELHALNRLGAPRLVHADDLG